jgi:hypothetical protein
MSSSIVLFPWSNHSNALSSLTIPRLTDNAGESEIQGWHNLADWLAFSVSNGIHLQSDAKLSITSGLLNNTR